MAAADVKIIHYNETYVRIEAIQPILYELYTHFQFYVKNYQYSPKYKAGMWNGMISLLNMREKLIYKGLLPDITQWCDYNQYSYEMTDRVLEGLSQYNISNEKVISFYRDKLQGPYEPLDEQVDAVKFCINNGRAIILAPTAMGKSYAIHALASFHAMQKQRVLIVIDRAQLIEQLRENLRDEYEGDKLGLIYQTVYDKQNPKDSHVYLTTWQSCYENDEKWFKQFDVIIGDEIHKFKAVSLKAIFDKIGHIKTRYGFTATLDNDSQTDRLSLKGMFGTPHRVATIKDLIEQGIVARPIVRAIIFEYSDEIKRQLANKKYKSATEKFAAEVSFIENYEPRNKFIKKINDSLSGNTLIAFKHEDHGKLLKDLLGENTFYASGKVKVAKRLEISKQIDQLKDSTAVVSIGTFSTGVNIKNVNNIIIACQLLSKITVPQLIGRGMRKSKSRDEEEILHVFDLGDNLTTTQNDNIILKHFKERLQMYAREGFEIKLERIKLVD